MKRVALLLSLVGVLVCAAPALATPQGVVQGGYDAATGALEGGFKIMAIKRVFSEDERYPPPNEVVTTLSRDLHRDVVVSPSLNSVQGLNLINVIADETSCDRLVLALRAGRKQRIFVLDSNYGPVYLAGRQRGVPDAGAGQHLAPRSAVSRRNPADGRRLLQSDSPWEGRRGRLLAL